MDQCINDLGCVKEANEKTETKATLCKRGY